MKSVSKSLFFLCFLLLSCGESSDSQQEYYVVEAYRKDSLEKQDKKKKIISRPGFRNYVNESFNFSLELPKDWNVHESKPDDSVQVVNFYATQDTYNHQFPILFHQIAGLTHFSFYPQGLGKNIPLGTFRQIQGHHERVPIPFSINEKESRLYLLENHDAYGYLIKPSFPPPGWNKDGFIYIQIAVDGFYYSCIDLTSGAQKSREDCDVSSGDLIRKYGNINVASRRAVLDILSSIHFFEENENPFTASDVIQISTPQPYEEINSPVAISGEAVATWYQQSKFPVILTDRDYQILARGTALGSGTKNNEGFIPFEISLEYKNPVHERGFLILGRANPSGKPEQDRSVVIPISFKLSF